MALWPPDIAACTLEGYMYVMHTLLRTGGLGTITSARVYVVTTCSVRSMSTSGKVSKNHPPLCDQMSGSTSQPSPLVSPVVMSSPSLSLWSRKLALQSEELNTLLQTSTTKLQSHQQELNTLLNTCKAEITHSQKQIELGFLKRDDEGMLY